MESPPDNRSFSAEAAAQIARSTIPETGFSYALLDNTLMMSSRLRSRTLGNVLNTQSHTRHVKGSGMSLCCSQHVFILIRKVNQGLGWKKRLAQFGKQRVAWHNMLPKSGCDNIRETLGLTKLLLHHVYYQLASRDVIL